MNILSLALAIISICIFAGAFRGHKWATLGLGLAVLTTAWVIQLLWTSADLIHF